ncbi:hypothetical protein C8J57DRAFT_1478488 [Mycena rebaudengoi]|nr:hypothetical protein C8J57DRAFT_1478488 [Mycena rebaudengoi]
MLFKYAVLPLFASLAGSAVAAPHRLDASMMRRGRNGNQGAAGVNAAAIATVTETVTEVVAAATVTETATEIVAAATATETVTETVTDIAAATQAALTKRRGRNAEVNGGALQAAAGAKQGAAGANAAAIATVTETVTEVVAAATVTETATEVVAAATVTETVTEVVAATQRRRAF